MWPVLEFSHFRSTFLIILRRRKDGQELTCKNKHGVCVQNLCLALPLAGSPWYPTCPVCCAVPSAVFINITESFNLSQHVSGPTHNRGHTLDLVFTLGLNIDSLLCEDLFIADHSCILFDLSFNVDSLPCRRIVSSRILNHLSPGKFSDPSHFNSDMHSDVDYLVQSFNEHFSETLDEIASIKTRSAPLIKSALWINNNIRSLKGPIQCPLYHQLIWFLGVLMKCL